MEFYPCTKSPGVVMAVRLDRSDTFDRMCEAMGLDVRSCDGEFRRYRIRVPPSRSEGRRGALCEVIRLALSERARLAGDGD